MIDIKRGTELSAKRNQTLNKAVVKNKTYEEAYGLNSIEAERAVAKDYVIDVNKRKKMGDEPRFTK